jgi:FlaA1/EpsC-like NDP-sugar epimerase
MSNKLKPFVPAITSGTRSFGWSMLRRLLSIRSKEIPIFSRDVNKQDEVRNTINFSEVNKIGVFILSGLKSISVLNSLKSAVRENPAAIIQS